MFIRGSLCGMECLWFWLTVGFGCGSFQYIRASPNDVPDGCVRCPDNRAVLLHFWVLMLGSLFILMGRLVSS